MKHPAEKLIALVGRHRAAALALTLLCGALSAIGICRSSFTNDVRQLFPDTPEVVATFGVLRDARLADAVQLEFISGGDITAHERYLDRVADCLSALPGVTRVTFRYRSAEVLNELSALSMLTPRFYPPGILRSFDPEAAAKSALRQLAFPTPGGVRRIREQPFDPERRILEKLRGLDALTGMRLAPELPYFVTRDRHRAMIVFDADIRLGDADTVRRLIVGARRCVEPLPPGVEWRIVSGCMHTLGNEETLKRDAALAGGVSLILFIIVFWFCYRRDWRALWIPLIPFYASLLSLGIMTLFFREICWYVIGLGSCITGLAVDQGIHVYAAFRGAEAERRTAALVRPMALSAATSIMVFSVLAATGIRAYVQLAVFAGGALALSGFMALALLPQLLRRDRELWEIPFPARDVAKPVSSAWSLAVAAVAAAVGFGGAALFRNADFTLEALDGTPEETFRQERDFNAAWRTTGAHTAVFASTGDDGEAALATLRRFAVRLEKRGVPVAGPPVPTRAEQLHNRAAWRSAETRRRLAELEAACRVACRKNRLPENFFRPFFLRLDEAVSADDMGLPPMLGHVAGRMVRERDGRGAAIALLPDTPEYARIVRDELKRSGAVNCALLSQSGFRTLIREELGGRFMWVLPAGVCGALLLAFLVFRRVADVLLAMVPVAAAFSVLALLGWMTGFRATPAAAFALVLLTGLAVDYGIYAVCELRDPDHLATRTPVALSAATTVAGSGALVFSRHPALFDTGVVISIGIAAACLSGLYLVPLLGRARAVKGLLPLLLATVVLSAGEGCAGRTALQDHPRSEELTKRLTPYPETPFSLQASARLERGDTVFSFILAAECDPACETVKAVGINPGSGTVLFRIGDGVPYAPPAGMPEMAPLLRALPEDLQRIFVYKPRAPLAVEPNEEYIAVYSADGVEDRVFPESLERRRGVFPFRAWRCGYFAAGREAVYENFAGGYTLRLKVTKLWRRVK